MTENASHDISSASFPALNTSNFDEQSTGRKHRIADSAPNIAAPRNIHAHRRSSTQFGARQSDRRVDVVEAPPTSRQKARPTTITAKAMSDLNLTNSMTSLLQSGSTSSHAWQPISTSATSLGARKPPSGSRRNRPTKRITPRIQPDDHQRSSRHRQLRRPTIGDTVSRPAATPLEAQRPPVDIKREQLRSALSSVFSRQDDTTPALPRSTADRQSRHLPPPQPVSITGSSLPSTVVPKPSTSSVKRKQLLPESFCSFDDTSSARNPSPLSPDNAVASAMLRRGLVAQERRRRCVSHAKLIPPVTDRCLDSHSQQGVRKERPQLDPVAGRTSRKPKESKETRRGKPVPLVDVTSGQRSSNRAVVGKSKFSDGGRAALVGLPRNMANVCDSHESLSDEGYYTKDSGSTMSLNCTRFSGPNHGSRPRLCAANIYL